jgi:hypothetical protein
MQTDGFSQYKRQLLQKLTAAGVAHAATHDLRKLSAIIVEQDKRFSSGRETAFALRIGTARGPVWACSENGHLVDEDERGQSRAKRIRNSLETHIQFLDTNTWPSAIHGDVDGRLRREFLALVQLDIFRWAHKHKPKNSAAVTLPEIDHLISALKLYRPQDKLQVGQAEPRQLFANDSDNNDSVTYFKDYMRADHVEYASIGALIGALSEKLITALPSFRAFDLCQRYTEDYLPLRIRIGDCYEAKSGVLCQLWVYLKPTKNRKLSPQLYYIVGLPVKPADIKLLDDVVREAVKSMNHQSLCTELSNRTAELFPLFRPFSDHKTEADLQALIKYAFVSAAESNEVDLPDHLITMNASLIAALKKVCERF